MTVFLAFVNSNHSSAESSIFQMCPSLDAIKSECSNLKECQEKADSDKSVSVDLLLALGMYFYENSGEHVDLNKAAHYFQMAADRESSLGQYMIGDMYLNGRGVPKNISKAVEFLDRSTSQGNHAILISLAYSYLNGYELPINYEKAYKYYRMAAEQGNAIAQYSIGYMYYSGLHGEEHNFIEAYAWYDIAARQGEKEAKDKLEEFVVLLDDDEVPDAKKIAENYYKLYVEPFK